MEKTKSFGKPIARLVFRGSHPNDGLIIGATLKGHNTFKKNTVYELREVLGTIQFIEVGESPFKENQNDPDSLLDFSWNGDIGNLLNDKETRKYLGMTREEVKKELSNKEKI